ncbi:PEP-CTERM sorting domain-containing protein [Aquincola sp. MAHUQ-54]|uniref:PEP-CTERM sorting domain-containing protein n=1 Tax=Aquincola agrisoli TaxID=3119538 RepID=A0AAW9QIL5_9BURK
MRSLSKSKTLVALAVAAAASGAQADLLQTNRAYVSGGLPFERTVDVDGFDSVQSAGLKEVLNLTTGGSFLAYCLQAAIDVPTTSAQYSASVYAASADVQELYDRFYGSVTSGVTQAVAFQLALWELVDGPAVSAVKMPLDAKAAATQMLDTVRASGTVSQVYTLTAWRTDGYQDVLQASMVPEPETYALMLAGVGAVAFLSRRRWRNDE